MPRWPFFIAAAFVASCLIYNEDLLVDGGGGAGTGASGPSSGGGGTVTCTTVDDCPGMDTTCGQRTCPDGTCQMDFAGAGDTCAEDGGQVCDGMGSCVECVDETQCGAGEVCSTNVCVDEGSLDLGEPCSNPAACMSMFCTDGVCCSGDCPGLCISCAVAGSEGNCANVADGIDLDDECAGADVCNGAGQCRCSDGMTNGDESDTDCGGAVCNGCGFGDDCDGPGDCTSMVCATTCQPLCGDMTPEGAEECDDGNTDSYDGCSYECLNPTTHLLLSEFKVRPSELDFIEVYNPTSSTVSLASVYLADYVTYYDITIGGGPGSNDFILRFPPGSTIGPGQFVVVLLDTNAAMFMSTYGSAPDYDYNSMISTLGNAAGLTDGDEMIMLFDWDGVATTVTDIDYVVYGNTSDAADKTGVVGYQPDTNPAQQVAAPAPGSSNTRSVERCDTAERTETKAGGNGTGPGHDETSEDGSAAWKVSTAPTPGAGSAMGFCP